MRMDPTKRRMIQRVEGLRLSRISDEDKQMFKVRVPATARFIGTHHDATILVILAREWVEEDGTPIKKEEMEKRLVLRVKDGVSIEYLGAHYIGSDNGWHLFEVTGGKEKAGQ